MKDNSKVVEIDQFKDEDVIKGLEVCSTNPDTCGRDCPYYALTPGCICKLTGDALDLINRQKAEIEKLNVELKAMRGAATSYRLELGEAIARIATRKSEAIKEFANNVKRELAAFVVNVPEMRQVVDNTVKEMTEEVQK